MATEQTQRNTHINLFIGGMNTDTALDKIGNTLYTYGRNFRITQTANSGQDTTSLTKAAIIAAINSPKGIEIVGDKLTEGFHVLATDSIGDVGIMIIRQGNTWSLYRVNYINKDKLRLTKVFQSEPYTQMLPDNFTEVLNIENDDVINAYIATTLDRLIVINILEDNLNKTTEDVSSFSFYPQLQARIDKVVSGKLKTGQVLYSYRFYKKHGIISKLSPLTKKIQVIDNEHTKEAGNAEDTNTSIGFKVTIPIKRINGSGLFGNISSMFDRVLVFKVYYSKPSADPVVTLINDSKLYGDQDVTIIDDGSLDLAELTSSEYLALQSMDIVPQTISSNQLYLFYANVLDKTQINIDFDSKAKSQDRTTGDTDKSDSYSNINLAKPSSPNHARYLLSGTTKYHGGTGDNVLWKLISAKVPIHWDYNNEIVPNKHSTTSAEMFIPVYSISNNSAKLIDKKYKTTNEFSDEIGVDLSSVGYDNTTTSSVLRSLKRNEVYRYGIIYYDKHGSRSDVLFILDIRTPTNVEYPCIDGNLGVVTLVTTDEGSSYIDSNSLSLNTTASVKFTVKNNLQIESSDIYFEILNNTENLLLIYDDCKIEVVDIQPILTDEQGLDFYGKLSKKPFAVKILKNGLDCGLSTEVSRTDNVSLQVYALQDITTSGQYTYSDLSNTRKETWIYDEDESNYLTVQEYDESAQWVEYVNGEAVTQTGRDVYHKSGVHKGVTIISDTSFYQDSIIPLGGTYVLEFRVSYKISTERLIEDTTASAIIDANVTIEQSGDVMVDGVARTAQKPVVNHAQSASIQHKGYNKISIQDVLFNDFIELTDADYNKVFNSDDPSTRVDMWKITMREFYKQFDKLPFVATIYKNGSNCGQYTDLLDTDSVSIHIEADGRTGVIPLDGDYTPYNIREILSALDMLLTEAKYRFNILYLLSNETSSETKAPSSLTLSVSAQVQLKDSGIYIYGGPGGSGPTDGQYWLETLDQVHSQISHNGYNTVSISDVRTINLDTLRENGKGTFVDFYEKYVKGSPVALYKNGNKCSGTSVSVEDDDDVWVLIDIQTDKINSSDFDRNRWTLYGAKGTSVGIITSVTVTLTNSNSQNDSTPYESYYNILSAKPIGIKFDIKVPVSSGITSYQIVRCEKTDEYTHNLMQVATARPIWQTLLTSTNSKTSLSPAYPTGILSSHHGYVKDMFGSIASRDRNQYKDMSLLFSPEITLYPKTSLGRINISNAKGYLVAYASAIFNNNASGYNELMQEILGVDGLYTRRSPILDGGKTWYDMNISYENVSGNYSGTNSSKIADAKQSSNGLVKYYSYYPYLGGSYDIQHVGASASPTWEKGFSNIQHSGSTITSGTKAYKSHTAAVRDLQFCNWVCSGDYDLRISCESAQPNLRKDNWCAFSYKKDDTTYNGQKEITGPGAQCLVVIEENSTVQDDIGTPPTTHIINITHNASQFAGTSVQDRQYDIYYGFGNYGTLEKQGDYMVGSIDVFDGDTYIMPAEIPTMFKTYNFESTVTTLPSALVVNYVPLETSINTFFDYGLNFRNTQSKNLLFEPGEITGVSTTTRPYSQYNKVYSDNNTSIDRYNAQSTEKVYNNYVSRIFYSGKKDNGESLNNWSIVRANDYIDAETRYGSISHAISDKNTIYMWQQHAFAKLSVNERSLVKDENGNSILLGQGGVLQRVDYISTLYGMVEDYRCAINVNDTITWGDYDKNKLIQYKGGLIQDLGKQLLVQNYINENSIFKNQPRLLYDAEHDEMAVQGAGKQLLLGSATQFAISQCDRSFGATITFNDILYGIQSSSDSGIQIKRANFFDGLNKDYISPLSISFSVNSAPQETKVFDNLLLVFERNESETNARNFAQDKTFTFKTNLGGSAISKTTDTLFTDRQGDVQFAIPRMHGSDYGNRLRGKWMEETMTFDNPFSGLSSVVTKFRSSLS